MMNNNSSVGQIQSKDLEAVVQSLKEENERLREVNRLQEAELSRLRRDASERQTELEELRHRLSDDIRTREKPARPSIGSNLNVGRCRNFPFITMSGDSDEEDESEAGRLVIDEFPDISSSASGRKRRKRNGLVNGSNNQHSTDMASVLSSRAAFVKAIQRAGRFGSNSPALGSPASGHLAEGGPAVEPDEDDLRHQYQMFINKEGQPISIDKDGRIVRPSLIKTEPDGILVPNSSSTTSAEEASMTETSAVASNESNGGSLMSISSRDLHEPGSITEYPDGYHIIWKGSQNGTDILHDAEGHRYCYHINERTNYPKPTDTRAFWVCTGTNPVTKKKCKVLVRECDGVFTPITAKEHFATPHPSARNFNQCRICVERLGLRK